MSSLTLFYTGGGPADPPWRYISRDASVDGPMELKFHDFVSFYICYVPLRPLFKKNFWKFEKSQKNFSIVPTSKGPHFEKKILKLFFSNFFAINHTFSIWIWILHVLSFLLMYITYTFIKIFEFSLFYYEFSVDYQLHSSASHSKNSHQKWPFLVPMDC